MTDEVKQEVTAAPSIIDEAKAERMQMEKVNAELKQNLDRLEKLKANDILGGRTEAGHTAPPERELSPIEYAEAWRQGKIKARLPGTF